MRLFDGAGILQWDATGTRPIHQILQLFECEENEDSRRLQTGPRWYPSLEHERGAFCLHRLADHTQRRLAPAHKQAREVWVM
jgi:hypothetical protein